LISYPRHDIFLVYLLFSLVKSMPVIALNMTIKDDISIPGESASPRKWHEYVSKLEKLVVDELAQSKGAIGPNTLAKRAHSTYPAHDFKDLLAVAWTLPHIDPRVRLTNKIKLTFSPTAKP
jgi:hypothetical protein